MRVAEIGDNCIDVYERIGKKYPLSVQQVMMKMENGC